ncbi:AAA family ATPase [Purpureocillium lavendulum]|uniref:AAA family ATPase n=1 Tax=Purpureocillium lavendulum TaxID=1247861 RepID=A0AB34FPT9_9HYPO|nr:AAA family ATPase [Purpureocillium lavendulum]
MWASTSEPPAAPRLHDHSRSSPIALVLAVPGRAKTTTTTTSTHAPAHGYDSAVKAMLRNKAFTVLQKTYDDSYLSCSTAVYYESQVANPLPTAPQSVF